MIKTGLNASSFCKLACENKLALETLTEMSKQSARTDCKFMWDLSDWREDE